MSSQPTAAGTDPQLGPAPARSARFWFTLNAAVAWSGLTLQTFLSATGMYPATATSPSQVGYNNPPGLAGMIPRLIDLFSYFTVLSNTIVAVVLTMLAVRAHGRGWRFRVVRLDSLMMILVTGIVYAVLLAPTASTVGWQVPANSLLHQITPSVTLLVFLLVGPRGWLTWRTLPAALVIPIIWVVYTLLRGAVIQAYPYPFINVVKLGYPTVLMNVAAIAVFGLAIGAVLLGVDRLLARVGRD